MKCRLALLTLLVVGLAALLLGCPRETGTETPKTETPVVTPTPGTSGEKTGEGQLADLVAGGTLMRDSCTQCHGIDKVEKVQKRKVSAEEWGKIVARMQQHAEEMKKTAITDEQAKEIVNFLSSTVPE